MATMRLTFVTGCQRPPPSGPGLSPAQADKLWEQVMAFSGYGFNQGHATAYAEVSYHSAYLRAHYPAPFLWARLMDRGGFHHPAIYLAEARRLGMMIRPPHVNVSGRKVTLTYEQAEAPGVADSGEPNPVVWLGLGQVRELRRKSIKAITQERPFSSLNDLLERVALQSKEVVHLIQCGALDGLGASRAAMLLEAEEVARAGNVRQMAFDFMAPAAIPLETAGQRLTWEMHLLGVPVSVNPLQLSDLPGGVPLRQLRHLRDQQVIVTGLRLPGWTGGRGWFLSDGDSYVIAQGGQRPPAWQPLMLHGRYRVDEWGGGSFQIE
jgi:DNA polymerase III alpha subunit